MKRARCLGRSTAPQLAPQAVLCQGHGPWDTAKCLVLFFKSEVSACHCNVAPNLTPGGQLERDATSSNPKLALQCAGFLGSYTLIFPHMVSQIPRYWPLSALGSGHGHRLWPDSTRPKGSLIHFHSFKMTTHANEWKWTRSSPHTQKINSKCIKGINTQKQILNYKILRRTHRSKFSWPWFWKWFLRYDTNTKRKKQIHWTWYKLKTFVLQMMPSGMWKDNPQKGKKICKSCIW